MMIRRITAVLAAFLMLAACSPEFNWRKVQLEQTGLSAMLPGKPTTSHRLLDFEQHQLDFYLTTATAGGQSYTVGHVILPKELQQDEAARQRLYEALHDSLRERARGPGPRTRVADRLGGDGALSRHRLQDHHAGGHRADARL